MATYTLITNATAGADAGDWSVSDSGTIHAALASEAGAYVHTGATGKDFRVDFTTQLLAGNETIDSIQACITANTFNTRTDTADIRIDIEDGGNSNSDYFTDTHTVVINGGSLATYCSDVEPYSTGTTAWTQSDIDDIRMMGEVTSFSTGGINVLISYAYITVETTVPPPQTTYTSDDATILSGGVLELKNGITKLG